MIVSSTELQNNFGKYLMLAATEDITITRNGVQIAKLSPLKDSNVQPSMVMESAEKLRGSGWYATYEQFLELTKESEERYEYIDGQIYLLSSPKTPHQTALMELIGVFYNWFQGKKCRPLSAPYEITLKRYPEDINIVQPDLMVICDLEEWLSSDGYYKGTPELVVEVLSESTLSQDLTNKLKLYMESGVSEYWIVDPSNKEVTIFQFSDKSISHRYTYRKHEVAESFVFEGLTADLSKVFR